MLSAAPRTLLSAAPRTLLHVRRAWVRFAGEEAAKATAAACIGSTSARAAEKLGIRRVYFPEHPGLEGFADSVMRALAPPGVQ